MKESSRTNAIKAGLAALCLFTLSLVPNSTSAGAPNWTFTSIDFPGASLTVAYDINEDGNIVGHYRNSTGFHGYLLSEGQFTTIDFPGALQTRAYGINSKGNIVGLYLDSIGYHGFLLQGSAFTSIDFPDSTYTEAWDINSRGDITGDYDDADGKTRSFLLTKGGSFISLDPPFAFSASLTHGLTPKSDTIVGCWWDDTDIMHSLIIEDGEYITNDFPDSVMSMNWRVNPSGQMVGRYLDNLGKNHAYLYSNGTHTQIDFPDAIYTDACGISASGEIVGMYNSPDGRRHGFLLSKE
jgi:uncharacterized membrane protein